MNNKKINPNIIPYHLVRGLQNFTISISIVLLVIIPILSKPTKEILTLSITLGIVFIVLSLILYYLLKIQAFLYVIFNKMKELADANNNLQKEILILSNITLANSKVVKECITVCNNLTKELKRKEL